MLFRILPLTTLVMLLCCTSAEVNAQDVSSGSSPSSLESIESSSLLPVEPPPGPIIVNYQDGQLTIEARNSTLSSVLRAACYQTGTALDVPPNADERVFGIFGPGPAREVFASLLNGSRFNYLMIGDESNAQMVVRLTLSIRRAGSVKEQHHATAQVIAKVTDSPSPASAPAQSVIKTPPPNSPRQAEPQLPRRRHKRR